MFSLIPTLTLPSSSLALCTAHFSHYQLFAMLFLCLGVCAKLLHVVQYGASNTKVINKYLLILLERNITRST